MNRFKLVLYAWIAIIIMAIVSSGYVSLMIISSAFLLSLFFFGYVYRDMNRKEKRFINALKQMCEN